MLSKLATRILVVILFSVVAGHGAATATTNEKDEDEEFLPLLFFDQQARRLLLDAGCILKCADSKMRLKFKYDGKSFTKTCKWVSKSSKKKKLCKQVKGLDDTCPKTCGLCGTASPTPSPSLMPSFWSPLEGEWVQVGNDIDGESAEDQSGSSVSLSSDGKTIAIGSPYNDDGNGYYSGHVRIFIFDGTSWTQVGTDIDGESAGDYSGRSVSLSSDGKTIAIGSPYNDDGNGTNSGHVRIFKFDGSSWTQVGKDIDGEATGDYSGYSVSLSSDGNIVAIGSLLNDGNGTNSGHVRIFKFDGSSWTQVGTDIDGESAGDSSGESVSLSADGMTVAVGTSYNDGNGIGSGHVRIFNFDGSSWTQVGTDIDGEAALDNSGRSVSLSSDGKTVAIGSPYNSGNGSDSGHVRIFNFDGSSWTQVGNDLDGEAADDRSGWSVSLSSDGNIVAIGSLLNDGNGDNSGHVRIFNFDGTSWTQVGNDLDGEAADDRSGRSVSLSSDGKTVAIGSPYNSGNGSYSGHVRVFHLESNV